MNPERGRPSFSCYAGPTRRQARDDGPLGGTRTRPLPLFQRGGKGARPRGGDGGWPPHGGGDGGLRRLRTARGRAAPLRGQPPIFSSCEEEKTGRWAVQKRRTGVVRDGALEIWKACAECAIPLRNRESDARIWGLGAAFGVVVVWFLPLAPRVPLRYALPGW